MKAKTKNYLNELPEFSNDKFHSNAQLRADTIPFVGVPYKDKKTNSIVLDQTPILGKHERIEIKFSDIMSIITLPDYQIGNEHVPMTKVFVKKDAIVLRISAIQACAFTEIGDARQKIEELVVGLDEESKVQFLENFERVLSEIPQISPAITGPIEMHVTCDAGHTDNDLMM